MVGSHIASSSVVWVGMLILCLTGAPFSQEVSASFGENSVEKSLEANSGEKQGAFDTTEKSERLGGGVPAQRTDADTTARTGPSSRTTKASLFSRKPLLIAAGGVAFTAAIVVAILSSNQGSETGSAVPPSSIPADRPPSDPARGVVP